LELRNEGGFLKRNKEREREREREKDRQTDRQRERERKRKGYDVIEGQKRSFEIPLKMVFH
jgi:hypothetical protein